MRFAVRGLHVRLLGAIALASLLSSPAAAGEQTYACVGTNFVTAVSCYFRLTGPAASPPGDPVYQVSVRIVRTVANARVTARVYVSNCGALGETRNVIPIGAADSAPLARFNWPTLLENATERCIQVHPQQCEMPNGAAANCPAVINAALSQATLRW